jgi:hypothetical protein
MPKPERVKIDCDDLLSKRGSRILAEVIVNYWTNRGHFVFAEGYSIPDSLAWGVRSNLVNGLPSLPVSSAIQVTMAGDGVCS